MISNENFYVVTGWMRELGLKGNELNVYAIIYGFSQVQDNEFTASIKYLEEWLGCSKPTIIDTLKKLIDKGLIIKEEVYINNIKFCKYSASKGVLNNLTGGKEILPNNIYINNNNINNNTLNTIGLKNLTTGKENKKFEKPTSQEVEDYAKSIDFEIDGEYFVNYYDAIGWVVGKKPMKDWKAVVRTWKARRKEEDKPKQKKQVLERFNPNDL